MSKLTIYCCYHKKHQLIEHNLHESEDFKLYYGPKDSLNELLNEYTMFYWIWKNDKVSDYIGTCHYRRVINPQSFNSDLVNENSCQVYEILSLDTPTYGFQDWASSHWFQCVWLWEDYKSYLVQKYGKDNGYLKTDEMLHNGTYPSYGKFMISRSSFILTREHFMKLCDFAFGFIDYLDEKYNLNHDKERYKQFLYLTWFDNTTHEIPFCGGNNPTALKRFLGYALEWLSSIYIQTNLRNYYLI